MALTLEQKRKLLELERCKMAKKELEFKIEERFEEIERVKEHVKLQEKRIEELTIETADYNKE